MSKQSLLSGTVCDTLVQVSQSTKRRKSTWLGTRADFPTHRSDFKDFKMKQNLKAFLLSLLPFWKGNQERIGRQQKQSQPESDPMVRCIYLGTSGTGPSTFSLYKLLKEFEMHFSALWEQSMPNELSAPLECVTHKEFCWKSNILFWKIFIGWGADSQHLCIWFYHCLCVCRHAKPKSCHIPISVFFLVLFCFM